MWISLERVIFYGRSSCYIGALHKFSDCLTSDCYLIADLSKHIVADYVDIKELMDKGNAVRYEYEMEQNKMLSTFNIQ